VSLCVKFMDQMAMEGGMPMTSQIQPRKICRHWASKGSCYMDIACGFLHPRDIEGVGMGHTAPRAITGPPRTICRHWERGNCQLDAACGFLHPAGMQKGTSTSGGYSQWQDVERATRENYGGYNSMGMANMAMGGYGGYGGMGGVPHMPMNMMGGMGMGGMGGMGGMMNNYGRPKLPMQGAPRRVCRHWERGNCSLGDTCGFLHTSQPLGQQQQQHQPSPYANSDVQEQKKSYQNNINGTYQNNNSAPTYQNNSSADIGNSELTNAKLEIERLQTQLAFAENEKKKLEGHSMQNQY
jgi:hypothetical protein